jgi:hypothetical protein
MTTVASSADATEAFNRIARGNFQLVVDAYAALEPKLRTFAHGLAAAIRGDDVEVMAFEYKRVEAFNRGVGALLNRIDATLQEFDAIAGDPAFAAVQSRAAQHVHALGAMRRTLTRNVEAVNRLEAKAAAAIDAGRRRSAEFDADWERLQDKVEDTRRTFDALYIRMARARSTMASLGAEAPRDWDELAAQAQKIVASASSQATERLRRELAPIGDAVGAGSTSRPFAVQFRKEKPDVERQLERIAGVLDYLRATAREITAVKSRLGRAPR